MSEASRTPGTWKVRPSYSEANYTFIYSDARERIACFHKEEDAQAAVTAANSHDDLVKLLERYMAAYPAFRIKPVGAPGSEKRIEQENLMALEDAARAALARATEGGEK